MRTRLLGSSCLGFYWLIGGVCIYIYIFSALHVRAPRQRGGIGTLNRYEENCALNDVPDS